jgi:hypothetical protein
MAKAPADTTVPTEQITQREAVKRALAAGNVKPADGVAYVLANFKMQLTNQSFSTLKSQLKKAAGTSEPSDLSHPSANGSAPSSGGTSVKAVNPAELARGVKQLVAAFGAEAVKQMVDVFAE